MPWRGEEAEDALVRLQAMLRSGNAESDAFCVSRASLPRQSLGATFDAVLALAREYEFDRALELLQQVQSDSTDTALQ